MLALCFCVCMSCGCQEVRGESPLGATGRPNAPSAVPRASCRSFSFQFTATLAALQLRAPTVQRSHLLTDLATPEVTRGITPVTAVTGPPVETPAPWEYPTAVWALLPWSGRPVTPHCSMRRPGAGGRSCTSPFEPPVRGQYVHYQADTTCHIALTVTSRLPLPHTQAIRRPLPMSYHRRCEHHMDVIQHIHPSHTRSSSITPHSHSLLTRSRVMPQPKNLRVTVQTRPPQQ